MVRFCYSQGKKLLKKSDRKHVVSQIYSTFSQVIGKLSPSSPTVPSSTLPLIVREKFLDIQQKNNFGYLQILNQDHA